MRIVPRLKRASAWRGGIEMEFFATIGIIALATIFLFLGSCVEESGWKNKCRNGFPIIVDAEVYYCAKPKAAR